MEKNPIFKKTLRMLEHILAVAAILLILGFCVRSVKYSNLFNQATGVIITQPNQNTYLFSTEEKGEDSILKKYFFFSGTERIKGIHLEKESQVSIEKSFGKGKIILIREGETSVLENEKKKLHKGSYDLIIVGRYFSGSVKIQ